MRVVDLRIAKELSEGGVLLKGTAKYGGSAHSHSIHTSNQKSSEIMRGGKKSPPPFPEVREKWGRGARGGGGRGGGVGCGGGGGWGVGGGGRDPGRHFGNSGGDIIQPEPDHVGIPFRVLLLEPLQGGLGFEILGKGLAGPATAIQPAGVLDEAVDANILVIRPLCPRGPEPHEQRKDD